jgi:hypothetical protein
VFLCISELHSFSYPNMIILHGYKSCFYTHSLAERHLGCFYFLTIMNNATKNIPVCAYVLLFLDIQLRVESIGYVVPLCLLFWGTTGLYSKVVAPLYIPTIRGLQFLYSLTNTCFYLFNYSHSNGFEMVSDCGFDLHFFNDEWCYASFHWPFVYLL